MAGNLGITLSTGITLRCVSQGGSSPVVNFLRAGALLGT